MRLENVPAPIKIKAKGIVLRQFLPHEQRLLKALRWRDPIDAWERQLSDFFLQRMAIECGRLTRADAWTTPDLLGLLSEAQDRALKQAQGHLGWDRAKTQTAVRLAFTTLVQARHEECIGIRNRPSEALSRWTDWEQLVDRDSAPGLAPR